jgi:hypothetical protein
MPQKILEMRFSTTLASPDPDQHPVLRIRDVYPGSQIRIFSIPDPNFFYSGSRIRIKEF